MIRLIDDNADNNDAWIHAVDIGDGWVTLWVKYRRPDVDKEFPHHDREIYHTDGMPQRWVAEKWPDKRWAAHFHGSPELLTRFRGDMSDDLLRQLTDHLPKKKAARKPAAKKATKKKA